MQSTTSRNNHSKTIPAKPSDALPSSTPYHRAAIKVSQLLNNFYDIRQKGILDSQERGR